MPLSTIFQLYRDSQFYWWKKPEYPEKTTDLSQFFKKVPITLSDNKSEASFRTRERNLTDAGN
jgi:hypothetical protein